MQHAIVISSKKGDIIKVTCNTLLIENDGNMFPISQL